MKVVPALNALIILGFGLIVGCSKASDEATKQMPSRNSTSALSEAAQVTPVDSLIDGYRDFKFWTKGSDLEALNNRTRACERIEGPQLDGQKIYRWTGINCYEIAGKRRNMLFFAGGKTVLTAQDRTTCQVIWNELKTLENQFNELNTKLGSVNEKVERFIAKRPPWSSNSPTLVITPEEDALSAQAVQISDDMDALKIPIGNKKNEIMKRPTCHRVDGKESNEVEDERVASIAVLMGPYSEEYFESLDNSLSKKYTKTSQYSEHDQKLFNDGAKSHVGNLYGGDQVALILAREERKIVLIVQYGIPEMANYFRSLVKPEGSVNSTDF